MSREITKRLLDGFNKLCPHNMSRGPGPICDECWVDWGAKEIERLLADERERVREMCAKHVEAAGCHCPHSSIWSSEKWDRRHSTTCQVTLALEIRQLDLTKDLAPSMEEEK